jgi:hypothetical protein
MDYTVSRITSIQAKEILIQFHYLTANTGTFRSGIEYGLFNGERLIGVAVFNAPSVPETVVSCFGLERGEQEGIYELGRLAIDPTTYEKNLTSWFLSHAIKELRKEFHVRAILTYADSLYHSGFIYQATNFGYYGLTAPKSDFFVKEQDGTYKLQWRGKTRGVDGEWRKRSRKHRYLLIYDKSLQCLWEKQPYPKEENKLGFNKETI